jgi:hypothetical protein
MGERNNPKASAVKTIAAVLSALSLAALFFTGCLSFGPQPQSFTSPMDSRLIAAVPFIPDDSSHCGPSTLAAVLSYHGRPTTKEEVAVDVQREDLRGSLGPDLMLWAREHGAITTFSALKPEQLVEQINKQKPVIALLDTGFGAVHRGHFVVIVGYGPDGVVANSGLIQQQLIPWSGFLTDWFRMGNFAILISGLQGAPETEPEPTQSSAPSDFVSPTPHPNIPTPTELQGADLPQNYTIRPEPVVTINAVLPAPPPPADSGGVLGPARDIHGNLILPVVPLPDEVPGGPAESRSGLPQNDASRNDISMTEETLIQTPPPPPVPLPELKKPSEGSQTADSAASPKTAPSEEKVPVMGWERNQ